MSGLNYDPLYALHCTAHTVPFSAYLPAYDISLLPLATGIVAKLLSAPVLPG